MFGRLTAAAAAVALTVGSMTSAGGNYHRSERDTRYLRIGKGWTGGGETRPFKGSNLAKRGARMAAKRGKAGRRAARLAKHRRIAA